MLALESSSPSSAHLCLYEHDMDEEGSINKCTIGHWGQ